MSFARKTLFIAVLVMIMTVVPASAALHFAGSTGVGSGSLVVTTRVAGVGSDATNGTVTVTLNVTGNDLLALCQNNGGKIAPGQNAVDVNVEVSQTNSIDQNGSSSEYFHVNLLPTTTEAGCPNGNWKVVDLLGYLRVHLHALSETYDKNGVLTTDTANIAFDCYYNEAGKEVTCTQDLSVS